MNLILKMMAPKHRILVFGADGMLGSYISSYFVDSVALSRKEFQVEPTTTEENLKEVLQKYAISNGCDYVFNAIGITNKITTSEETFNNVNGAFPIHLSNACDSLGLKLFHPSTDCVFTGSKPIGESGRRANRWRRRVAGQCPDALSVCRAIRHPANPATNHKVWLRRRSEFPVKSARPARYLARRFPVSAIRQSSGRTKSDKPRCLSAQECFYR